MWLFIAETAFLKQLKNQEKVFASNRNQLDFRKKELTYSCFALLSKYTLGFCWGGGESHLNLVVGGFLFYIGQFLGMIVIFTSMWANTELCGVEPHCLLGHFWRRTFPAEEGWRWLSGIPLQCLQHWVVCLSSFIHAGTSCLVPGWRWAKGRWVSSNTESMKEENCATRAP